MRGPARITLVAVAAALLATACTNPSSESTPTPTPTETTQTTADSQPMTTDPVALPQVASSPVEPGSSGFDDPLPDDLPPPLVPRDELVSGGPPPDGIPAIDDPRFIRVEEVTTLTDDEPVLSLEVEGEARAYPVGILIWHEIVNDTIAGIPVAVTYCPLCNSALVFDRRLGDRVLDFGVSGLLYHSDLVMFDRQTESLWPQLEGRSVIGRLTGAELDRLPIQTIRWADFRAAHPGAWVLSEETGFDREYGNNPYVGYDDPSEAPFLFDGIAPPALPAKARVVGLGDGSSATAISLERLSKDRVLEVEVGGVDVVVLYEPDLTSALDRESLADSKAVGSTGAFRPEVGGERLTFGWNGASFSDQQTGSTWSILGRALDGPLKGRELEPVDFVDTFWFAWSAFQPATSVID